MKFTTFASILSFALAARAADIDVDVGEDGLVFTPNSISCNSGDTVTFHFYPGGHSVVSSDFGTPCQFNGMISSGTVNSDSGESSMVFRINCPSDTTYLFCSQAGHCGAGMVAAINAPSTGNTVDAYKSAAQGKGGPVVSTVTGGDLTTASAGGEGGSGGAGGGESSSSSMSTAAATSTAAAAAASPASNATSAAASPTQPAEATGNDASTSYGNSAVAVVLVALVNALFMA